MRMSEPTDPTDTMDRVPTDRAGEPDPAENRPMSIEDIQAAYAEYADWFHRLEWFDRLVTGRYRCHQFGGVDERVLDVACGTGTNFPYLASTVDLVGVDISPEMLQKAQERVDRLELDGTLHRMDAQSLEFDDDTFDTVISALSTCTFPNPVAVLREMQRVCAPDGQILLLEHGRSDVRPLAWYQDWRAEAHYQKAGCRWTQQPLELVRDAGLSVERARTALFDMITMIDARPGPSGRGNDRSANTLISELLPSHW